MIGPAHFTLYVAALRIEGDEGAWQQVASPHFVDPGGRHTTTTGVFEGEGAYEGLMAVVELSNTSEGILDLSGFILEGEVPPISDVTRDEGAG